MNDKSNTEHELLPLEPRDREFQFPDVSKKFPVLFEPRWSRTVT
jgi:hypothetical protein